MAGKKKLVVLTGAGISAESGLKTFRDSDGLWNGYNIEDGIPPDIKVDITDEDKLNHIDTIIETALDQF